MSYFDSARPSPRGAPPHPLVRDILPPEKRGTEEPFTPQTTRSQKEFPAEAELQIRTWEPEAAKRRRRTLKFSLVGGAIVLFLGFTLPLAAFPQFEVTIAPKVAETDLPGLSVEATTAISSLDAASRRIPGVLITLEDEEHGRYPASGRRHFEERARGTIIIANAYSSAPQTLVAGTRFRAPGGEIFRLTRQVTVPGARIQEGKIVPQSTSAEVVADQPGEASNLGPGEFRIPGFFGSPKYEGFTAKSEEPFRGGFQGQAAIVSAEDLRRAEEELSRTLIEKLERELGARIPAPGQFLAIPGSRQTLISAIERPSVGERRDSFNLSVKGQGRMLLVNQSQLLELVRQELFPNDPLAALSAKQPKLSFLESRLDAESGRMTFRVEGRIRYYQKTPAEEIAGVISVSTPGKIEAYLRGREEIAAFRIKKFPAWLWFVPRRTGGIRVTVEEPQ